MLAFLGEWLLTSPWRLSCFFGIINASRPGGILRFSSWSLIVLHFSKYEVQNVNFQSWVEYNKNSDFVDSLGYF